MRSFLKHNSLVLCLYVLALLYALSLILNYEKEIVHIYLNRLVGQPAIDSFFFYITWLGDGAVAPFLLLLILVYNVRKGLYCTASFLSASLFSIALKRLFFDDINRPFFVFQWPYPYPLTYVEGVDKHIHNSFPSGHATQAFAIFMCLAFTSKNQLVKLLFFTLALLTAFSRVYLSQHWLNDITAGSFIGVLFSILFYYVFIGRNILQQLNRPVYQLKKIERTSQK